MWKILGNIVLKVAIWSLGHTDVIAHTIQDAKAKDVKGLAQDAALIAGAPTSTDHVGEDNATPQR